MSGEKPRRKQPVRRCVACRAEASKRELVRFVRHADGTVDLDATGRENGRGAYVCARQECFDEARKHRKLEPALKAALTQEDYNRLEHEFKTYLESADAQ